MTNPGYHKGSAHADQMRSLLSEALRGLEDTTPGKVADLISQLEQMFAEETDMSDKLLYHAALVGILTTMQLDVEATDAT